MDVPVASQEHEQLVARLRAFVVPWRKLTIAVDGRDGSGKSTIARFLAWQLGMPVVETDFALTDAEPTPQWDVALIARLVAHRHDCDRPVLVEGIFVLENLVRIGAPADFVVRVSNPEHDGTHAWAEAFAAYEASYYPCTAPSFQIITPAGN